MAQALLRSHRRRGEAPRKVLPGNRQIRGKTADLSIGSAGQEARAAWHQHPCASIAVRVRKPGTTGPLILTDVDPGTLNCASPAARRRGRVRAEWCCQNIAPRVQA